MNINFNFKKENSFDDETRYNSSFSQYIKNKLNKKDHYFKYNKKKHLLYLSNIFCKKET